MSKSQTMTIRGGADIIKARMQVRNLAREQGFSTIGQARISMATSSLAYELGLGRTHRGAITIDCLDEGSRSKGLRVSCIKTGGATDDCSPETFGDVRFMVDQLTVENLPPNDLQVTLIKWRM